MLNCYYSIQLHIGSCPADIDCGRLMQLADEISALLGCTYDRLGHILLHPDHDLKDLGRMMTNSKKNREKFAQLSIPARYYGKYGETPGSPTVSFERRPKNNGCFPPYDIRFQYPCIDEACLQVSIDVKAKFLTKELTLADFAAIEKLLTDSGYAVDSAYVYYCMGNAARTVLGGVIWGLTTPNDYRVITHAVNYLRHWKSRVMDVFYMNCFDRRLVSDAAMEKLRQTVGDRNILFSGEKVFFRLPQRRGVYLLDRLVSSPSRTKIKGLLVNENICEKDIPFWAAVLRM